MEDIKIIRVEKISDLNGIGEHTLGINRDDKNALAFSDGLYDSNSHYYRIIKKVFCTDGSMILFVESKHSLPIDEQFIEHYFSQM